MPRAIPFQAAASRTVKYYPQNTPSHELNDQQNQLFYESLPSQFKLDSHYGYHVPDDSALSREILSDARQFIGEAGMCVVFDGYNLLHRGGLCLEKPRMALQIMLPSFTTSFAILDELSISTFSNILIIL